MSETKRLLVIGAHNDDPDFSTAGLTARLTQMGWEARHICVAGKHRFTKKQIGTELERAFTDPAVLARYEEEDRQASGVLGAEKITLTPQDNTFLVSFDEAYLRSLIDQIEDYDPDIALIHFLKDNHQEHVQSARLSMYALSHSKINCEVHAYESGPWQGGVYFIPDFTINITPVIDKVEQSMMCYHQASASGHVLWKEKKLIAQYRGYMAGYAFGESYKIIRYPCGDDPELLLPKLFQKDYRWGGGRQYLPGYQYDFLM